MIITITVTDIVIIFMFSYHSYYLCFILSTVLTSTRIDGHIHNNNIDIDTLIVMITNQTRTL